MVHHLKNRILTAGKKIRTIENLWFSPFSLFRRVKATVFDSFLCHKFFPGNIVTHFSKIVSLLSWLLGFLQCFQPGLSNNWLLFFGQLFVWRIFRLSDRARVSVMKRRRLRITQHMSVCKDWIMLGFDLWLYYTLTCAWCRGPRCPGRRSCSWPQCSPPRHRNSRSQNWNKNHSLRRVECIWRKVNIKQWSTTENQSIGSDINIKAITLL